MIPAVSDCNPGFDPVEYNVIIAPERLEERTKGGIILAEKTKDTQELATMRGRLLAVSPLAFNFDKWPEGSQPPQVGDAVIFSKYGGTLIEGPDGVEYRVCKDKDIVGVIRA